MHFQYLFFLLNSLVFPNISVKAPPFFTLLRLKRLESSWTLLSKTYSIHQQILLALPLKQNQNLATSHQSRSPSSLSYPFPAIVCFLHNSYSNPFKSKVKSFLCSKSSSSFPCYSRHSKALLVWKVLHNLLPSDLITCVPPVTHTFQLLGCQLFLQQRSMLPSHVLAAL